MNPLVTLRMALSALHRNKMRSFLTTLGIIIGVAAVIAMVAIGQGARTKVEDTFAAMGTNLLIIIPGTTTVTGTRGGFGSLPTLTFDDVAAIGTEVPTVRYSVPILRTNATIVSDEENWTTGVYGTTPDYFALRTWRAKRGELFGDLELDGDAKVAVLGKTVADELFGSATDPIGATVRIKNVPFRVIGVLEPKGQSPMGQDYDDAVVVPVTTYQSKIQGSLRGYMPGVVMVGATSAEATGRAQDQITALLRERHHLQERQEDDFSIRDLREMAKAQEQGTSIMTLLLACVAGVSLFVGGIGVMNIMLVSVTERTREIGLRMAIGAKPGHILLQFMAESLALSCVGGLIGILAGLGVAQALASRFHWPFHAQAQVIALSVGFSVAVGLVFGIYPARKASRLNPIDALRYE